MKTLNETVLELYDNFKSYRKEHTVRELAEHLFPDWEIKRLSDFGLVVVAVIETCEGFYEFRVQVSGTDVYVRHTKIVETN